VTPRTPPLGDLPQTPRKGWRGGKGRERDREREEGGKGEGGGREGEGEVCVIALGDRRPWARYCVLRELA